MTATHQNADGTPRFTNRLAGAASPYLLQHAHNPVDWYPWGEEAFARARAERRLVLLSVGYATCHWCHVMERESFEDLEVAALLNQHFVAVKVDREERPDVDEVYMTIVQLVAGHGGWPMTLVLTPEKEPLFAGTYLPARDGDRGAAVGFLTLLRRLQAAWAAAPERLAAQARSVAEELARVSAPPPPGEVSPAVLERAAEVLRTSFDARWGGFGRAPKFPRPATLDLVARLARRTGDAALGEMLTVTLERMAEGGIYDHLAGGFHRYATDREWTVPHFEKMLYDQALLVPAYLDGLQRTGRAAFARIARETLDYVARELRDPGGGFYSATDADSANERGEAEEGWCFTWTPAELEAVLGGERAAAVASFYGVSAAGSFEGRSVLRLAPGTLPDALPEEIDAARAALLAARQRRPAPLLDDKVITAWNGLMIAAFARAGRVLAEPGYVATAAQAARFLFEQLRAGDQLLRLWRRGEARQPAFLEDYAALVGGLLELFAADGDRRWLDEASALQRALERRFAAPSGGYRTRDDGHEPLLLGETPAYDGAVPAPSSLSAHNLLRLAAWTGEAGLVARADALFAAHAAQFADGQSLPAMLAAFEARLDESVQVVLAASRSDAPGLAALEEVVRRTYLPNLALLRVIGDRPPAGVPWAEGRPPRGEGPVAYVCRGQRCGLPTGDARELGRQLAEVTPLVG